MGKNVKKSSYTFVIYPISHPPIMEEFLAKVREDALYIKVNSQSYGGAVQFNDVLKVLENIHDSYKAFLEANYSKVNQPIQKKKYADLITKIIDKNDLLFVDLDFKSFSAGIAIDTISATDIPKITDTIKWKADLFKKYKREAFYADFNSLSFRDKITKEYSPEYRNKIFTPIIEIATDQSLKVLLGDSKDAIDTPFVKPSPSSINSIISPKATSIKVVDEYYTALAEVSVSKTSKKARVKELFDDNTQAAIKFDKIESGGITYKLTMPLLCELKHVDNLFLIENEQLGVFVQGETQIAAEKEFSEEFEYIYQRYNELSDDQLTERVKAIKAYLNLIVE